MDFTLPAETVKMRIRVTFSKTGSLRYIGHLDLHQIWERTARRAGLPLAYTQGFHPGPRIQIAAALPLGFLGRAEMVDMWLNDSGGDEPRPYANLLQNAAPPGLTILTVEPVDEKSPALQTQVVAAEYEVSLLEAGTQSELETKVAELLAKPSLPRERRGKPYDLRPLIQSLTLLPSPDGSPTGVLREGAGVRLEMILSAREGATGRPEEVLAELNIPFEQTRIERTRLIFKSEIE
jgi:radical SAM-linked protein